MHFHTEAFSIPRYLYKTFPAKTVHLRRFTIPSVTLTHYHRLYNTAVERVEIQKAKDLHAKIWPQHFFSVQPKNIKLEHYSILFNSLTNTPWRVNAAAQPITRLSKLGTCCCNAPSMQSCADSHDIFPSCLSSMTTFSFMEPHTDKL